MDSELAPVAVGTSRRGSSPDRWVATPTQKPGRTRLLLRAWTWALNITLALVWLWFAKIHLIWWLETGDPRGLGAMAIETIVAVLFLTRRPSAETSLQPPAWGAAMVGTLGPMFMRPEADGGGTAALVIQLLGAAFAVVSLLSLRRSFGLVAANRGIVARGPYSLVRHPAYLGYFVTQVGYVLENPSLRNGAILLLATAAQLTRIRYEEQILAHDSAYCEYRRRVRFRLVPLVY